MWNSNIILITIDSLRKDHCGCYGYSRDTTPFIDKISQSGVRFKYPFANGPLTPRSFPSILTGQHIFYGKENDIHSYFLPKDVETIAQKLRNFGYYSGAFQAGNPFISSFYGYNRGFDHFDDFLYGDSECERIERLQKKPETTKKGFKERFFLKIISTLDYLPEIKRAGRKEYQTYIRFKESRKYLKKLKNNEIPFIRGYKLNQAISKWLEGYDEKKPLFLWVHYMDVHQPHIPKEDISRSLNIPLYSDEKIAEHWSEIANHEIKNSKQIGELIDLYDCEIRYVDKCIEEIFEIFSHNNLTEENSLFILTSDHGEEYGEHGSLGHEMKLYNEMLSVPLIVFGKDSRKYEKFADALVELKSVPQIILDAANGGEATDISRKYVLSQSLRKHYENWVRLIALQNKKFKLIYDAGLEANNEFYNLNTDLYEKNNLYHADLYAEEIEKFNNIIKDFLNFKDYRNRTKQKIRELKDKKRLHF
jgi:arylsulfatase A-like enzyme